MNNSTYFPILLIILFIGCYIVALLFLSHLSGWYRLSKKYTIPNTHIKITKVYRWRSLNLNYLAAYRRIVHFKVSKTGLMVEPSFFLFFFHKPLFLPWDAINDVKFNKKIFKSMIFKIGVCRAAIGGAVAEVCFKSYQEKIRDRK